jgi:site-specific DNA recombinase
MVCSLPAKEMRRVLAMSTRPEKVIHYARVSSQHQAEQYGLRTQRDACRELSARMGWEVVAEYEDTVSGVKMTRNGLDQAMEALRDGRATAVVAYHLDRLHRDPAHHYLFIAEMKRLGARVYYTTKGGKPVAETDDDEFLEGIEALVAFRERSRIRSRTLDARRQKARDGNLMGNGETPYGYRRVGEKGRYSWEVVEEEAAIVRRIYEMYLAGTGINAIVRKLTEQGIPTPSDARNQKKGNRKRAFGQWNDTTVYKMLRQSAYSGEGHTFRQKVIGETESGAKRFAVRPPSEWYSFRCPVIIDPADWKKVQAKLDEGKAQSPRNSKYEYLMGRRIRCDQCKSAIVGRPAYKGQYRYYSCEGRRNVNYSATHGCTLPPVRAEIADAACWQWVVKVLLDDATLRERATENQEANSVARARVEERRVEVAAQLADLALTRKRLRQMLATDRITELEFDEDAAELDQKAGAWQKELEELDAELAALAEPTTLEENLETAAVYRMKADGADFATRRGIIEDLRVKTVLYQQDDELRAEIVSSAFRVRDDILITKLTK